MKLGLGIALLVAIGAAGPSDGLRAQGASDPCSVLTDGEIGAVVGARVSAHRGQGDLSKPDRANCTWSTASPKQGAMLAIGRVRAGAKVQNDDWVRQMTQFGWKAEVAESTPTLWFARMVEPAKVTLQLLPGAGGRCEVVMKGFYFSLDASGPNVTAAQVKNLVDKMVARLP